MSEPDFTAPLSARRIAILGIGLIGGSLAYALQGKCDRLFGVDSDPDVVAATSRTEIFDVVAEDPRLVLPQADFLILAAPLRQIIALINDLPQLHPGTPVVLDMGSTKGDIVKAMQALPDRFFPVGGHPMAGKEVGGLENANAELFKGAAFSLVKVRNTPPDLAALVETLVAEIGARPVWLDADTHDRITSEVSHLPYLLASALALATPLDGSDLVGSGFQSTSRLAGTPPAMMLDIIHSNRSNILEALERFKREIDFIEALIAEEDYESIDRRLKEAQSSHAALTYLRRN